MRRILLTLLISIPALTIGQKLDMDLIKGIKPRSIGPAGMAGRVTTIDAVNSRPEVIYVGTASGGLWKSESGGIAWKPIFDDQTTASIGAVAIQQSNPSVIWVGTGEGNPRNSLNGGDGIYKSLDAGKTWNKMGLEKTRHIHRIIVDPMNPNTVYVAAIGSPWGIHSERGVFKTTDGGKTWNKILYVNDKTGAADLVMDPNNPNKLIVAMWEHYRQPWFFTSGGEGSGMYITHDGGENWVKRTDEDGLPKGNLGRMGLAIAPSNPDIIYALIESKKNALYKSTDGGFKWSMVSDKSEIGNRPFYYSDLFVDPANENRLYSVFTYVNVSNDGGKSFDQLMPAYGTSNGVHPDHHAFWVHPEDPNYLIEGNDGGLNISRDRGQTWRFVENIPVAQFYHIAVDNEYPYNVYGGMQDNGSWAGPAYVWKAQGIRNSYWQEISFGDGFDVIPDPDNSRYGYSMSQEGFVAIYDRVTGYNEYIRPTAPDREEKLRFNWNSAIAQDPFDNSTIYFGSQFVHKSTDKGVTWKIISPDLTTNDKSKQKQDESGGLTMDATGAENYCTVIAIEPSSVEKGVIWATTDDGKVQLTRDGGSTWTDVSQNIKNLPKFIWIPQVKASNKNAGEALVVANNYRNFDYTPYAYRTTDYGKTWERILDASDVTSYTLSILQDPVEPKLYYLGTDDGLYISIDGAASWTKWKNDYPTVNTMDLVIHPREQDLVIGTFGRAAWVIDDIRPLRAIASSGGKVLSKTVHLFEPPTAYQAMYQQPTGTRFGADAMYNGDNREGGAMLSFVVNAPESEEKEENKKDEKEDEDKVSYDSLTLEIYNTSGDLIRTLKQKAPKEKGINRMYWRLDEKGVNRLTKRELNNDREPGGAEVLPGTYQLKLIFGDQSSEASIEVKGDPRRTLSMDVLKAKYDAIKALEANQELAVGHVEQLKEKLKIVETLTERMKAKDEKGFEEQIKLSNDMKDTLNSFMALYFGKEDDRQGITADQPNTIDNYLGNANFYLTNALHSPSSTEEALMKKFKDEMTSANDTVDNFLSSEWPKYKEQMESLDLSPFKD
ncbi:WD40/YVTN/BNR-like repeat-containing protein [Marinoscillum sp.]|uniref:WD40/YVTN/BNR-like repeat-containing protein n=1 Tax=Marinoscillum sp. TaxID=2024838 RepID=UPI003BA9D01F